MHFTVCGLFTSIHDHPSRIVQRALADVPRPSRTLTDVCGSFTDVRGSFEVIREHPRCLQMIRERPSVILECRE